MLNTILFDLDGTLLPMDQEKFEKKYFSEIEKKMKSLNMDSERAIAAVHAGVKAIFASDGALRNDELFWKVFRSLVPDADRMISVFDEFYLNEYLSTRTEVYIREEPKKCVDIAKSKGYTLALATNPVFPGIATHTRMGWSGLKKEDFALITVYENSHFAKPNPKYYLEVIAKLGKKPEECLMIGNDAFEDMMTKDLGMEVFLLTECLINRKNADINLFPHGNYAELLDFLNKLPVIAA